MTIINPSILYTSFVTNVRTRKENIKENADGERTRDKGYNILFLASVNHIYNISVFKFILYIIRS